MTWAGAPLPSGAALLVSSKKQGIVVSEERWLKTSAGGVPRRPKTLEVVGTCVVTVDCRGEHALRRLPAARRAGQLEPHMLDAGDHRAEAQKSFRQCANHSAVAARKLELAESDRERAGFAKALMNVMAGWIEL